MRVKRLLEFHLLFLVLFNLVVLSLQSKADWWIRGVSGVLSPPVILIHRLFGGASAVWNRLEDLRTAERENRELRQRLFWTRLENDRLRLEALYLRQFKNLREGFEPMVQNGLAASIVRRRSASYYSEVLIDAGSGRGVRLGQVALAPGGVVGLVAEVGAFSAIVRPIVHPDSVISVVDLRSGTHAIARGDGTAYLELKYLPPYADILGGDAFVTDCWDQQYPPGLPVATAEEAVVEEGRLKVRLRPGAEVESLHWLTLIEGAS